MKNLNQNGAINCSELQEMSFAEANSVTGGGFAYDAGFFFRELWVYASNGGGIAGSVAVGVDMGLNYRPVN